MIISTAATVSVFALANVTGLEAAVPYKQNFRTRPVIPADLSLTVNGKNYNLNIDTRTTLLDTLREHLELTGTKGIIQLR